MTKFESKVFEWICKNCDDDALQYQLQVASVSSRENTGAGCYSEIELPHGLQTTVASYGQRGPLTGPEVESPALMHGAGTLLWFEGGYAKTLEVFTYDDEFPSDHDSLGNFTLRERER